MSLDPKTKAPIFKPTGTETNSDSDWWTGFGPAGVDGNRVNAVILYQGALVIAGDFGQGGGFFANFITRWDGTKWTAFGSAATPGPNGQVFALAVNGTDLYVGGEFTSIDNGGTSYGGIARWDGSAWHALGSGVTVVVGSQGVRAIAIIDTTVYVGGNFSTVPSVSGTQGLARWSSHTGWATVGSGWGGGTVNALLASGSTVYVGGTFAQIGGLWFNGIGAYSLSGGWSKLGRGVGTGGVNAFNIFSGDLVVGGAFTTVDSANISAPHIAKYNGSWGTYGPGISGGDVKALTVLGSTTLVAGGTFTNASDPGNHIAKWTASSWVAVSSPGPNNDVNALGTFGSAPQLLIAGGSFTQVDQHTADHVASWSGSAWATFGNGIPYDLNKNILGMSAWSCTNDVYAVGDFLRAGYVSTNRIARWNGSQWSALGGGIGATGNVVVQFNNDLVVGGTFTSVDGGTTANRIAKWTPGTSSWGTMGSGFDSTVKVLVVFGGEVYAGGLFTLSGSTQVKGLAKWTGSAWGAVGDWNTSVHGSVTSLGVYNGQLYAATTDKLFRQSSGSWTQLTAVTCGSAILCMANWAGQLIIGGEFQTLGAICQTNTVSANRVVAYNGTSWAALGNGLDSPVRALAVYHGNLIVAGDFTADGSGSVPLYSIARWNGSSWIAMGTSGPFDEHGKARAMAVVDDYLYVGGDFWKAGGNLSQHIARYGEADATAPSLVTDLHTAPTCDSIYVTWTAVGDDSATIGCATTYDLRVSGSAITSSTWASATQIATFAPGPPGTAEFFQHYVGPCSAYKYYAIKVIDEAGNTSPLNSPMPGGVKTPCSQYCNGNLPQGGGGDLLKVSPNPTSTGLSITFRVGGSGASSVIVAMYDVAGRRTKLIERDQRTPGTYTLSWDQSARGKGDSRSVLPQDSDRRGLMESPGSPRSLNAPEQRLVGRASLSACGNLVSAPGPLSRGPGVSCSRGSTCPKCRARAALIDDG